MIIIMVKNIQTGFFESELGSYNLNIDNVSLLDTIYAVEEEKVYWIYIKVSVGLERDVSDEEFETIFDAYDASVFGDLVESVSEDDDCYNPTWIIQTLYVDDTALMEQKLNKILAIHKELIS